MVLETSLLRELITLFLPLTQIVCSTQMQTQTGDGLGAALQGASSFLMSALCGSVAQQAAAAKLETARRNIVSANNERASVYPAQPLKQKVRTKITKLSFLNQI